jgi:hypothetical protein
VNGASISSSLELRFSCVWSVDQEQGKQKRLLNWTEYFVQAGYLITCCVFHTEKRSPQVAFCTRVSFGTIVRGACAKSGAFPKVAVSLRLSRVCFVKSNFSRRRRPQSHPNQKHPTITTGIANRVKNRRNLVARPLSTRLSNPPTAIFEFIDFFRAAARLETTRF